VLVPELQLTGYPPEDLVLKPEFVRKTMETAERLVDATVDGGPALLFGSIHAEGGVNYNASSWPRAGASSGDAEA
jgi:NAD+ synthase